MKSTHSALALLVATATLTIVFSSASATEGPDNESHLIHVGNITVEYFSVGKGETVVLLPGGSLSVNYLANLARSPPQLQRVK